MYIGLVGGIGPAATDYYYRGLIEASVAEGVPLELTVAHADSPTLLLNLERNDKAAQVDIFLRLTERLKAAGADVVAITAIAGHFCINDFKVVSPLLVVDLLEVINSTIRSAGIGKVGLIGTQTVMETKFYGAIDAADVIPPSGRSLADVHQAYVAMASSGKATDLQRQLFYAVGRRLVADHAVEAVLLGGTDLVLAFDRGDHGFDVIDCARIHVEALARLAAARDLQ